MNQAKQTFETALARLEQASETLKKDGITLEEALNSFEQGMKSYEECFRILTEARQRIEVYSPDEEETQP